MYVGLFCSHSGLSGSSHRDCRPNLILRDSEIRDPNRVIVRHLLPYWRFALRRLESTGSTLAPAARRCKLPLRRYTGEVRYLYLQCYVSWAVCYLSICRHNYVPRASIFRLSLTFRRFYASLLGDGPLGITITRYLVLMSVFLQESCTCRLRPWYSLYL